MPSPNDSANKSLLEAAQALLRGRVPPAHIAIEGPIGAGKTTLCQHLANALGHELLLEDAYENPFLERFYSNPRQYALPTQLHFLFQRAQQAHNLRQHDLFGETRVADFMLEKDALFARVTLDPDEQAIYQKVYRQLAIEMPAPDLVIYLQASPSTLLDRIQQRGIKLEQHIDSDYLERLNEVYSEFFLYYDAAPLLIVNANELDLASNRQSILQLIDYLLDIKSGRHYFNPTVFG